MGKDGEDGQSRGGKREAADTSQQGIRKKDKLGQKDKTGEKISVIMVLKGSV